MIVFMIKSLITAKRNGKDATKMIDFVSPNGTAPFSVRQ